MSATSITQMNPADFLPKKPMTSKVDPSTANCYLEGGPFYYALHGEALSGERGRAAVDPDAPPQARAEALSALPVVLSETHIHGGKYSQPTDDAQSMLVKIPEDAVGPLQDLESWAVNTVYQNQSSWGLKKEERAVVESRFEPLLKSKEGSEGYAMNCKMFTKKCQIFVQDPDNASVFHPNGTHYDMRKGSRCAIVLEIRGIRLKSREFAVQTPILSKVYVFTNQSSMAAPSVDFGGFNVSFAQPVGALPAAAAAAAAAAAYPDDDVVQRTRSGIPYDQDSVADSVYKSALNAAAANDSMDVDMSATMVCAAE